MKKLLSLALCVILVLGLAVSASAALEYTYIDTVYSHLQINRTWGIATCTGSVDSTQDVRLDVDTILQVYKNDRWENVYTWSNTGRGSVTAGGDYAIARGYQYRLYVTGYSYHPNGTLAESGSAIDYVNYY